MTSRVISSIRILYLDFSLQDLFFGHRNGPWYDLFLDPTSRTLAPRVNIIFSVFFCCSLLIPVFCKNSQTYIISTKKYYERIPIPYFGLWKFHKIIAHQLLQLRTFLVLKQQNKNYTIMMLKQKKTRKLRQSQGF